MRVFSQGDVVCFDYNPTKGHEPTGSRPSIVVSNNDFNARTSMVIVCPVTRTDNGYPLHFAITTDTDVTGYACAEQIRAVDLAARGATSIGRADKQTMSKLLEALQLFF